MKKSDFGEQFCWGTTISSFQNEGAATIDGKEPSIWDNFCSDPKNIKNSDQPGETTNFYANYENDIKLAASLNLDTFRFSISWSRIFPKGEPNPKGVEFYTNVIDCCLKVGLTPWVTLYHWDLPQSLQDSGGWTNRATIKQFVKYVDFCTQQFKDKVKHWIVMNEPMSFTGLGYFQGYHAPGLKGINNFLRAGHHVVLAMAEGGRTIRKNIPEAKIGVALSCSVVKPINNKAINKRAAERVDALLNRFYLEPLIGRGYPFDTLPSLSLIKKHFEPGDEFRTSFDFDFIGIQYYFKVVCKFNLYPPILMATEVPPTQRNVKLNVMNLEVHPKGLYTMLKYYSKYPEINQLLVTESGVCFEDKLNKHNQINDSERIEYHKKALKMIHKAQKKDISVDGYLIWTLVDNFEWREGYKPRFGLIYNDSSKQKRILKDSALWFRKFLEK